MKLLRRCAWAIVVLWCAGCSKTPIPKPVYWHYRTEADMRYIETDHDRWLHDLAKQGTIIIDGGACDGGMSMIGFKKFGEGITSLRSEDPCGWVSNENPPRVATRYQIRKNGFDQDVTFEEYMAESGTCEVSFRDDEDIEVSTCYKRTTKKYGVADGDGIWCCIGGCHETTRTGTTAGNVGESQIGGDLMSNLRPECKIRVGAIAIPDDTALFLIRDSVERRRSLIHGRLDDNKGNHCALGCFWQDNPNAALNSNLIDEVAAVNDAVPPAATPQERWKKVRSWLRWKIKVLAGAKQSAPGNSSK